MQMHAQLGDAYGVGGDALLALLCPSVPLPSVSKLPAER